MGIITSGQNFESGDQVTSDKLMDIARNAQFDDPCDNSTIIVDDGKLKVPGNGITANELRSSTDNDENRSVTTNHIKDNAVTSDKLATDAISAIMPTGTVIPFAGSTLPGNTGDWLFCDGSEYSETGDYSNLFSVIQSFYNTGGETANHFRVPDLRGRVIAGKDNMGGSSQDRLTGLSGGVDGDTLGATGGDEKHELLTSEMPSHTHFGVKETPTLTNDFLEAGNEVLASRGPAVLGFERYVLTATTDGDPDTAITSSTGGGQVHNNVQPTIILNYIIKT